MTAARVPLLALLALAAACKSSPPPASPLSSEPFGDIVAPRGAIYREANGRSFAYRRPTFRCGRFEYDWRGPEADAVRFYKERMTAAPYSWTFSGGPGDEEETGSTRLYFVKGDDRCIVDIDRIPQPGVDGQDNLSIVIRVNYRR
jgi:hypothetical protein